MAMTKVVGIVGLSLTVLSLFLMVLFPLPTEAPATAPTAISDRTDGTGRTDGTDDESDESSERAFFDAAWGFGKVNCGDEKLARIVARESVRVGIEARVLAIKIGKESGCNPLAISNKGAVGLAQVMPGVWKEKYDFSLPENNLFNPEANVRIGAEILAEKVKEAGGKLRGGLRRYNGAGPEAEKYADRIMALARRRGESLRGEGK